MITIAHCLDLTEALRLQMLLGCESIESFIPDENSATLVPHYFFRQRRSRAGGRRRCRQGKTNRRRGQGSRLARLPSSVTAACDCRSTRCNGRTLNATLAASPIRCSITSMDEEEIRRIVARTLPDVRIVVASAEAGSPEISWGDTFFFYGEGAHSDDAAFPFATIVTKDYGEFDNASNLNRAGVFRLNIGLSRNTFRSAFGENFSADGYDFTILDKLMPHPVYAPQFFACILNPSDETFEKTLRPLLAEAYEVARKRNGHA